MVLINNKIGLPGVALPFYREFGTETPIGEQLVEGQNYGEHQLFALRSRLESDRDYADLCSELNTNISFVKIKSKEGMVSHLCINYIKDGNIETIIPDWLEERVEYWLNKHSDYFALLTDRYPTGLNQTLPTWWLRDILSKINLQDMIRETFYPDDIEVDVIQSRDVSMYDYFYEDGVLFVKLIDPSTSKQTNLDRLASGEVAFRRIDQIDGDYADYASNYYNLQLKLLTTLDSWYREGTLILNPQTESSVIKNWNLVELENQPGIYQASWDDVRFTFYDGITPMLYRQLPSYSKSWDYQLLYFYMNTNPSAVHDILKIASTYNSEQTLIVQGDMLLLKLDNYNLAVSYADMISEVITFSHGTVIKDVEMQPGSIAYYDAIDKRNVYISKIPDEHKFILYSPRSKPATPIRASDLDFLNKMELIPKSGLTMENIQNLQNIQSPLFGSPNFADIKL